MSDNHEVEQGNEPPSDPESMDELFLSPDDSNGEEVFEEGAEAASAGEPAPETAAPEAATQAAAPDPGPTPAPSNPADSEAMKELAAERDDYRNRMMRVAADLENFRKRTQREKDDLRKYGIDRVVLELLPVIDNLERALEHADKSADSTTIVDGVRMVHRQFITALEKHGVKGFDAKGEQFDPQKHEAIQQVETTDHATGHVLEEYQKGYYLHERLIRPALVVVARNPEAVAPVAAEESEGNDSTEQQDEAGEGGGEVEVESGAAEDSESSDESAVN